MAYTADHCWKCCSPLHHRPDCQEMVPLYIQEATRRELKRYHQALSPVTIDSFPMSTVPVNFPLKSLSIIIEKGLDFYHEMDIQLDELGRPTIDQSAALALYKEHKMINFNIYHRRQTDKDLPSDLRQLQKSQFGGNDDYFFLRSKGSDLDILRSRVWVKSCRLLVWTNSSLTLIRGYNKLRDELRKWVDENRIHVTGRPTAAILKINLESKTKQLSYESLKKHSVELLKICRVDQKKLLESNMNSDAQMFLALVDLIENTRDKYLVNVQEEEKLNLIKAYELEKLDLNKKTRELQMKKDELENMTICSICLTNQKNRMLMCGHCYCAECLHHLEAHANDPPTAVEDGVGIEGIPLFFMSDPTPANCPVCHRALRPRRVIYF